MENYKSLFDLFNHHLNNYSKELITKSPKELYEPERYILSIGGKRIRPLLSLIACDLFDVSPKLSLDAALCVELFHNFSLIHDDILDKAPLRRGKETVHAKWNSDIAILSGDVMLAKAFQILKNYEPTTLVSLLEIFSTTAIQVCEGQQLDMNFENQHEVSVIEYINMITNKTAVLLGCSLKMGAICAKASSKDAQYLYDFGKHLGIAFQLMDDVLDVYAESEKFGKQIGGDIIANKKTILLIKALELANEKKKEELVELQKLKESNSETKINGIMNIYDQLNVKDESEKIAAHHTKEAIRNLNLVNANSAKKMQLEKLAFQLLNREK